MPQSGLTEALPGECLREWRRLLGDAHVIVNRAELDRRSTATFETSGRVLAVVRPADRHEVQECVRIAGRFGVPLYPVSTGKNWGYGSAAPSGDGVTLDLGRMNRITGYDEELAYVTIEPGVTQRQLHAFLQERGGRLWMDATGASPDCSIVGNTLERGFGHTPMGDHAASACNLEVVLASGEVIETGFGGLGSPEVAATSRAGVGPSLDGLFTQSNLGIVTRMTVWLMPAPEAFLAFFFLCRDEHSLPRIVDALRPLRLDGTLRSTIHVANDYKVVAASGRHPTGGAALLGLDEIRVIRRELGIGAWNGSGGLYGSRAQVRDAKRRLKRALGPVADRLQFVDDRLMGLMRRFAGPFGYLAGWDVGRTLEVLEPAYNLLKGIPSDGTLKSVYWRKTGRPSADADPDRDRCGLIWCSPVLPTRGSDASLVAAISSRTLLAHGFEPQMSLSLTSERSAICVTTIGYDREVPGEDARAWRCYEELVETLVREGYPPYRLNVESVSALSIGGEALSAVTDALDPGHIIAPGRYAALRSTASRKLTA